METDEQLELLKGMVYLVPKKGFRTGMRKFSLYVREPGSSQYGKPIQIIAPSKQAVIDKLKEFIRPAKQEIPRHGYKRKRRHNGESGE